MQADREYDRRPFRPSAGGAQELSAAIEYAVMRSSQGADRAFATGEYDDDFATLDRSVVVAVYFRLACTDGVVC